MTSWVDQLLERAEIGLGKRVEIYGLVDPRTNKIRYIGKANDSRKRLKSHIRDARRRRRPVCNWITKLGGAGLEPGLIILARPLAENWPPVEKFWISEYRKLGGLLNVADGGDEPFCARHIRAENGRKVAKARFAKYAAAMEEMNASR